MTDLFKAIISALVDTLAWLRLCCPSDVETDNELVRAAILCVLRLVIFVVATLTTAYAIHVIIEAA